ncbi:hypothetical protein DUT91_03470 [Phyllobacterium salinisoli]|uniref:Uncharacterized protein n=1 Tax=Phyllobacterium salinisoli TaxID=1899321 RepID=A0A368K9B5_9HYPH|nr:hypothetical protein [Phyllobacterium salinisoli]RCS25831.1 hypothetical protein DUT91_03470 [Phyllobacterium salinisoli]
MNRQALLIAQNLESHDVKALRILVKKAMGSFEPLGSMSGLGQTMVSRFIDRGLAEMGLANAYTGETGYRATALGRAVYTALDLRKPNSRPKIRMLEPRINALPSKIGRKS